MVVGDIMYCCLKATAVVPCLLLITVLSTHGECSERSPASAGDWTIHSKIQLEGLRVELSEPVLVKKSRWYCWFPSLYRQPDGTLWAQMSAYPDIHVSEAVGYLSRSRDGGLTWDEARVVSEAGPCPVNLPDGSLIMLPYYLRQRPDGSMGSPCNVISPQGELAYRPAGVTVTGWPRPPAVSVELGTVGFVFNDQVVQGKQGEFLTTLYGTFAGDTRYSLLLAESNDGFAWRIRSTIAGPDCPLRGNEGPCEAALARLPDGRLMCLFRLDSFVPYGQAFSDDDGYTWSAPENIGPGSVQPSLAVLPGGLVALSGGRPGIYVWFNTDGTGRNWQAVDIVAAHNACRPAADRINPDVRMGWGKSVEEMKRSGDTGFTSCYTDLAVLDERTLLLIYDRVGFHWLPIPDDSEETKSVWVMRLRVDADSRGN